MRRRQYWRKEKEKMCRICGKEEENFEHAIRRCEGTKNGITLVEFLGGDGKRLEIMRKIDKMKKENKIEDEEKEEKER